MATYNNIKKIKIGDNVFNLYDSGNTDTWRPIQVNGTQILAGTTGTNALNLKAGTNVTVTNSSGTVTIAATDTNTTYSAGTGLSLSGTTFNHSNSITAGTVGTSSATSGSTLAVPYVTYDAQGHITATGTHTHTISGFLTSSSTLDATKLSGTIPSGCYTNTTYGIATNTTNGLVKPWYTHTAASTGPTTGNNTTAVAVNTITATAGKYYAVEADSDGRLFVNVPWTDHTYTIPTITLNGSATTSPSFYAPTSAGTSGYYLKSNGSGAPTWAAFPSIPTITDTYSSTSSNGMSGKAVASALGNYIPLADIKSGTISSTTVPAGSYVDVDIVFSSDMSSVPIVVCSVNSLSTSADIGSITASAINATKYSFTIRIFNNSANTRAPAVSWIAYA